MRRFVGHLWCALLPVVTLAASPIVLSRDELLRQWNDTMALADPSWVEQEGFPDIVSVLGSSPEYVLPYSYRIFDGKPCGYTASFSSLAPTVFFEFAVSRRPNLTNPPPAALLVDFSNVHVVNGDHLVSDADIETRPSFFWPAPWRLLSESLASAQNGHLPLALQLLTYPGFESWCWSAPYKTIHRYPTGPNSSALPYPKTLEDTAFYVLWDDMFDYGWASSVESSTGWDVRSLHNNTNSPIHLSVSWSPRAVTSPVKLAPSYPGPFWYQNVNDITDGFPDYVLSGSALEYIAQEFADAGEPENNPFGDPSLDLYAVFPVGSDGKPKVDVDLRFKAIVREKGDE